MENIPSYWTTSVCLFGTVLLLVTIFLAASIRVVREDTRLSVYRLGRYLEDKGPGLVVLIPLIDRGVIRKLGDTEKTPSRKLVGTVGKAHTTIFTEGKVLLADKEWDAISQTPISAGRRVRVIRLILEVEEE